MKFEGPLVWKVWIVGFLFLLALVLFGGAVLQGEEAGQSELRSKLSTAASALTGWLFAALWTLPFVVFTLSIVAARVAGRNEPGGKIGLVCLFLAVTLTAGAAPLYVGGMADWGGRSPLFAVGIPLFIFLLVYAVVGWIGAGIGRLRSDGRRP